MLHKDRKLFLRGQGQRVAWHESWRNIARRTLFDGRSLAPFVILLIIILAIMEHNRLRNSCEGGHWRMVDGEVMCVHSPDTPAAGQ